MMHLSLLPDGVARTRVKICCIASVEEAEIALEAGADALGLVSAMPSGPGMISDARIAEVSQWARSRAATVLLTSRQHSAGIAEQLDAARPAIVQICDELPVSEYECLRQSHPGVALMQVIHVRGMEAVAEASGLARHVDAFLLDSGNPAAAVKELGGTGRVHDWRVSRALCAAVPVPVFLAGGLRPENVGDAVTQVRPFGVDVCSGVRRDGVLDAQLAREFVATVRAADAACAAAPTMLA
jgi:phosphoribosylanthranilate isomerase